MSTWEAPSLPSQLAADPRTCASGHRDPQGPAGTHRNPPGQWPGSPAHPNPLGSWQHRSVAPNKADGTLRTWAWRG